MNGANAHELAPGTTLLARVSSCHCPHNVSAYCSVTFRIGAEFLQQSTSVWKSLKVLGFTDRQNKTPTTVPNLTYLSFRLTTSQSAVSGGLYGTFGIQGLVDIRILYLMYLCVPNTIARPGLIVFAALRRLSPISTPARGFPPFFPSFFSFFSVYIYLFLFIFIFLFLCLYFCFSSMLTNSCCTKNKVIKGLI